MLLSHIVLAIGTLIGPTQPATAARPQIAPEVRKHLLSLPYYGVYDLLAFAIDSNNVVSLGGYVMTDTLKSDAEREVREIKGVTDVQNRIEIARALPIDADIRHAVYHAVYGDAALSRYGTPGSEQRAMRPGFRPWGPGIAGWGFGRRGLPGRPFSSPQFMAAPFYGYDPIGDYAIHILVKDRTVTLAGVVDNEDDKTLAGLKVRGVRAVLKVNNELEVATRSRETK
jgi:hypothetical protein